MIWQVPGTYFAITGNCKFWEKIFHTSYTAKLWPFGHDCVGPIMNWSFRTTYFVGNNHVEILFVMPGQVAHHQVRHDMIGCDIDGSSQDIKDSNAGSPATNVLVVINICNVVTVLRERKINPYARALWGSIPYFELELIQQNNTSISHRQRFVRNMLNDSTCTYYKECKEQNGITWQTVQVPWRSCQNQLV